MNEGLFASAIAELRAEGCWVIAYCDAANNVVGITHAKTEAERDAKTSEWIRTPNTTRHVLDPAPQPRAATPSDVPHRVRVLKQ